jgi:hypothetical protein
VEHQSNVLKGGEAQDDYHLSAGLHSGQAMHGHFREVGGEPPDAWSAGRPGRGIPSVVPGARLAPTDVARVDVTDWAELQRLSRAYCRTVDASRSRKRMDGSATVVRHGLAPYSTDDISDDVTQDAVLLYAQRLARVSQTCKPTAINEDTGEADAWKYVRKDGQTSTVTRETIRRWAVHDAAARNGYRREAKPPPLAMHAGHVAVAGALAQQNGAPYGGWPLGTVASSQRCASCCRAPNRRPT